ncbi:MAG TPA: type II secretion system protein [Paenibacillus sp.]|jgi:type IV pilus assembly protein PilA
MLAQAIKRRLSKEENQKGFTLIELLAVIVILGIIAVIAIPMISNVISKSRSDADVQTARQIYDAARMYITADLNGNFENDATGGTKTILVSTLQTMHYLESKIYLPSTKVEIEGTSSIVFTDKSLTSVILNGTTFNAASVLKATPSTTP